MKRDIIVIDEEKCTGCGVCVPSCKEGALQIIDGKARLISDLYCDGLGACVGHCPFDAMKIEQREAEAYDERKVMLENIIPAGENTIKAHLQHLMDHNGMKWYEEAVVVLEELGIENPIRKEKPEEMEAKHQGGGCPGSKAMVFGEEESKESTESGDTRSQLRQWPVQLHLLSPYAPYFENADLLLAADCVAFAMGNFHSQYLKDKTLAIACPKLDSSQESYIEKLVAMIDESKINTITCMIMEVPCCSALLGLAKEAVNRANSNVPIKAVTVGLQGEIIQESWV